VEVGQSCRISTPCAQNREGSVDRRIRAANQASEVPLGKGVRGQLAAPDVGGLGSDTLCTAVLFSECVPILVDSRDGAVVSSALGGLHG
jgi:hypothetical protein